MEKYFFSLESPNPILLSNTNLGKYSSTEFCKKKKLSFELLIGRSTHLERILFYFDTRFDVFFQVYNISSPKMLLSVNE